MISHFPSTSRSGWREEDCIDWGEDVSSPISWSWRPWHGPGQSHVSAAITPVSDTIQSCRYYPGYRVFKQRILIKFVQLPGISAGVRVTVALISILQFSVMIEMHLATENTELLTQAAWRTDGWWYYTVYTHDRGVIVILVGVELSGGSDRSDPVDIEMLPKQSCALTQV